MHRKKYSKSVSQVILLIREMTESSALESGQSEELLRAIDRYVHGMRVQNLDEVEAATGDIARAFLRNAK